ncbi:aromatic-ring-hydroxylating dioxygenase subunit beta [Parageobacillus thermoglucosidasius]|uniref:Aromatic-ring-hydroxylating dioxygenase subunit beta n=2 Tax=Anoxybacillaceae TaxID=3120669 RepID=A0AAN1D7B5_PARTM|nr:3-phenylpropionate/cinnamic acid dioxygenase subunit beta [Parageobacillus thermoglucosidasius]ALF10853.1 aromatic-ring-hydroxylating dioxygenase [Parageobacillus thermoglucosidasius]ANZ30930.1 aromatic-ring-hydroxylating dioxygenase subunit beta [Parageobacillus thermoglucosidasius]APM81667.1 aromatic-ring-hydroxylating dioxygenase subunit beta [Parageobacillus thermoglucosidasius]KJX67536.1 aromatic-ring-hydroxylating dioxygenase [Parageobacillus thermoglucosidasius]MED4906550.1 3-phenylp
MNPELQFDITNFLHHEAYLLDHRRYKEWLDLLADDLVYRMPARITTEGKHNEPNIMNEMTFFEETKKSLITRVKRLDTPSAWAEYSGPRQRHFISNIYIESSPKSGEYQVRSYFLYQRCRGSDLDIEQLHGERVDVLRKENGKWKIASRTIYPDQTVLRLINLSMFL